MCLEVHNVIYATVFFAFLVFIKHIPHLSLLYESWHSFYKLTFEHRVQISYTFAAGIRHAGWVELTNKSSCSSLKTQVTAGG